MDFGIWFLEFMLKSRSSSSLFTLLGYCIREITLNWSQLLPNLGKRDLPIRPLLEVAKERTSRLVPPLLKSINELHHFS